MTIVALTHPAEAVATYFTSTDLARLRAVAEVRIVGQDRAAVLPCVHDVELFLGSWGMPRLDDELLAAAPRLRGVAYAAGTVKGFVTPASYARGVVVTTAMQANAIPVAEVTEALVMLINKDWFRNAERSRRGLAGWREAQASVHDGNFGTTVGIIGFGAIGRLVVERLARHDLELLVYDPMADPARIRAAGAEPVADLRELARRSRITSLHAPNIPATRGMCDAAFFAAMPDGATFINTARGQLVDEAALIAALATGRISAHLDVTIEEPPAPDSPLWRLPNVWLSPHRAGSSSGEIRRMGRMAVEACLRMVAGETPDHVVTEAMLPTMA